MGIIEDINGKNIYRQNGFRIFNLPITAKPNKVNSEFSKIEAMKNLNDLENTESLDVYTNLAFPVMPKPNFLDYQDAKNRLSNPRTRFLEELFWFWPEDLKDKKDGTLRAIKKGDIQSALSLWNSSNAANAEHNLAVYNHVLAVDDEIKGDTSNQHWNESLKHWNNTLSSNDFKNMASQRIDMLNNAMLKQDYLEEIFANFALMVLSINVSFAEEYYKKGDQSNFTRHIDIIKNSDFDTFTKDESLNGIFTTLYDSVNEKFEEFENNNYKSKSDIPKIEKFLVTIDGDLSLLANHFQDNQQFQMLSDKIAEEVTGKYVNIIGNEMEAGATPDDFDFNKIEMIFNSLMEMAYTPNVKDNIAQNLEGISSIGISTKINSFMENAESATLSRAKSYANEMENELANCDSQSKEVLSENFAMSLQSFVVSKVNSLQETPSKLANMIYDLKDLLKIALKYANDTDNKMHINSLIDQLSDLDEQLENNAIMEKINSYAKDVENKGIHSTKAYISSIKEDLSNLNSKNKKVISDNFAISLQSFVVSQVNSLQEDPDKLNSNLSSLKEILEVALEYATQRDTKKHIKSLIKQLDDVKSQVRQAVRQMEQNKELNSIMEEIKKFADDNNRNTLSDAEDYVRNVERKLKDVPDSSDKKIVGDQFAITVLNFAVSKFNESSYNVKSEKKRYEELLIKAAQYASKNTLKSMGELLLAINPEFRDYMEANQKAPTPKSSSGGGIGGAILCIVIIIVIFAAVAYFLGFI